MKPKEPPEGCQEIPGFIVDFFDGSAWLTKECQVTTEWDKRGVWATYEEAETEMMRALRNEMMDGEFPMDSACPTKPTLRDNRGVTG